MKELPSRPIAMEDDTDFSGAHSGASMTFPKQCSALRKNEYVILKSHPCKIVEMSTSKTGKHGHAKVHLTGIDIFTNKKHEDICPSTHNMEVPCIKRTDYELITIDDDFATLLSDEGIEKADLRLPDKDLGKKTRIRHGKGEVFKVTVLQVMDIEKIIAIKNLNP
ncbi:eukaryotic translation initiation factor 5A-1-like [Brachionichthys hirsutus]|uniref:eukaryotic translation initiation factor 5A-1-like n=1 Tax=Brachionichthys hirsutus TaxID=412623 RepID=UPI003604320B